MSMPPPPPPGPVPPPHNPYGTPYGYASAGVEHPQGTTILVLGILSLVVCAVLGPIAWSMGNSALREMDAQPGTNYTNRGNVTAGRICGIISSVLIIIGVVFGIIALIAVAAGSTN